MLVVHLGVDERDKVAAAELDEAEVTVIVYC